MTHTCIRILPSVRSFLEEDRLEIEEEEAEIFTDFQSTMGEYDEFRETFACSTAECAETFFEKLDYDLSPTQPYCYPNNVELPESWKWNDTNIFRPSDGYEERKWLITNGKWIRCGHEEGEGESSLLGLLFDQRLCF